MIQLLKMREVKRPQTSELASEPTKHMEGRGAASTAVIPV